MCSELRTRQSSDDTSTDEDWARAKEHWNEFSAKFSEKFNAHFNEERRDKWHARRNLIDVKLPNGREFSFSLGHVILAGLLIWWLPFNLVILFGLLWVAYQVGQNHTGDKPKRDENDDKPKRKTGEGEGEFEIYRV